MSCFTLWPSLCFCHFGRGVVHYIFVGNFPEELPWVLKIPPWPYGLAATPVPTCIEPSPVSNPTHDQHNNLFGSAG